MQMTKKLILLEWRRRILEENLLIALILLELFLSIIFILIGYLKGNIYFRGVGVGLVIAWVTNVIAYLFKRFSSKH
ncbi:hypothetical protein Stok01_02507 [Sulfurisphaera tokodaii]